MGYYTREYGRRYKLGKSKNVWVPNDEMHRDCHTAGLKLPTCALSCGQTAGSQVGCNITDQNCVCNSP
ncbi:hypothetical protein BGY98DRAFT_972040, partial [Russula aff. rugulosa BPL654]